MVEATTRDVPTDATRRLIQTAAEAATQADEAVSRFIELARRAVAAFNAETGPLALTDAEYEAVVSESGLRDVLDLTNDMEQELTALLAGA